MSAGDGDGKKADPTQTSGGGFSFGGAARQGSGKRTLAKVKTHFYVGTEVYTSFKFAVKCPLTTPVETCMLYFGYLYVAVFNLGLNFILIRILFH